MSAPSSPAPIADSQSQTQEYTLQPSLPNYPIDGGEVEPEDPTEINVDGEGDASQEGDDNDEEDEDVGTTAVGNKTPKDKADDPTKKRERKAPAALEREPGKSLFPFSRVQKIIRADKEMPIVAKEATFLISIATEEFLKRFTQAAQRVAEREKRLTVQARDIAHVVHNADEYSFMSDILGYAALGDTSKPKRKPKGTTTGGTGAPTMLDRFITKPDDVEEEEEPDETGDVIMNEDGTMGVQVGDIEDMDDD
ncbi:histone-fold-containing protein [Athelia psychrophila]|uniref:Histone-fold-containing protein n=1 Tax=Athelia psychrophila TaxID=1759441 RepID=A0A166A6W5_9AGAM|nr:histone-fold-containing protein [Fibularhizoctonia sp. CBS 109695]